MKKRIWELDAFRGICILGMVIVHFVYDLVDLYGLVSWEYPKAFLFVKDWGGVLFLVLSGICVTLGTHSLRRGLIVFCCGMICTLVTYGMYRFGFANESILIYFGILHCLGVCMLLWPLLKKAPSWLVALLGIGVICLGFYWRFSVILVETKWLMPLGLCWEGFASSDYFPLLPYLGFFLLGAPLGRLLYPRKESLFPKVNPKTPILQFLCSCGRQSLWIYLLHQPILSGLCFLLSLWMA